MTTPSRRPIRTDFRLSIDAPSAAALAAPPWAAVALGARASAPGFEPPASSFAAPPGAVTRTLNSVWASDGGGRGGRPLDEALTNLGESYIQGDRVVWEPPADLSPEYVDYLSESAAELNRLIEKGVIEIDADGNIRPKSEG